MLRTKLAFIKPSTAFLEKLDATLQRKFFFALIKSKCLPVLFYGTEAGPITSADKHSLEFTMNKVLYKIFGAMSKDSYGEICKYFGIDKKNQLVIVRKDLLRDILDTATHYVTRYPLGCGMLNY